MKCKHQLNGRQWNVPTAKVQLLFDIDTISTMRENGSYQTNCANLFVQSNLCVPSELSLLYGYSQVPLIYFL